MDEPKLVKRRSLMDKSVKEQRKIIVIAVFFLVTLFFGSSYALLTNIKTTTNNVVNISTGNMNATVVTNQNINLTGKLPETDESGLLNATPVKITITNTGTINIAKYQVKLLHNTSETSTLDYQYVKFAISFDGTNYTIGKNLNSESNIIYTGYNLGITNETKVKEFYIKAWIDENAGSNGVNKQFYGSVSIDLLSNTNDLTAKKLIKSIKDNKLKKDSNNTPLNYVTETNNGDTITYLSGCSKYYLDQNASGCTQDNTIDFNYVWYSGRMWRITSFNETTNTIKLITEEPQTVIAWHESTSNGGTSAFEGSYEKQFLNDEFYDTLYNPTNFIDTSVKWDITTTDTVSTKLSNPTVTSNVGLLNSYEYYQSYQKVNSTNKYDYGYLNIGQWWWLLNPYSGASRVWFVSSSGSASYDSPTDRYASRPSINLLSDVSFIGSGTESDPYRMVGDINIGATNDYLKDRWVGEYVKLKNGANEQVFRIVSFENNTTKLVALDYADSGNNKKFATANSSGNGTIFGEGNTLGSSSDQTWYYYLTDPNNSSSYINDLKTKYGSGMFTTGNYYLGINANNPSDNTVYYNYRTSICASTSDLTKNCVKTSTNSPKSLEAGLLRYGEMFAAQHGIGYDTKTSTNNTMTMWLMTRRNASRVWVVVSGGYAGSNGPADTFASRPSINLVSGVKIVTCDTELCDGTPSHPYVVGL